MKKKFGKLKLNVEAAEAWSELNSACYSDKFEMSSSSDSDKGKDLTLNKKVIHRLIYINMVSV